MTQGDDLAARLGEMVLQSRAATAERDEATADRVARAADAAAGALEGAAATVARRAHELERAAEALPEEVTVSLQGVVSGVRAEAEELTARLQAAVDAAVARVDEAVDRATERLTTAVEALEARLTATAESVGGDVQLTTQGLTAVGKNVLDGLLDVMDERDARDAKLEDRLTARVDRLTKKTADRVAEIAALLDDQITRLDERDVAERAYQAEVLHDLVQQLLAQPRGVLKDLRRG